MGENNGRESDNHIMDELKSLLRLAAPLVMVNVLVFSLQLISVMFHLGELQLSGASMATSFASVTGFSLLTGMASALETFCGQAYGAQQQHILSIYMQRAMFILLIICIPLSCIWANAADILILLGQDREISIEAGRYACLMIPSIFAFVLLQCEVRFLQAQKKVLPLMLTFGFTTLLHALSCWLLIFKFGLGFRVAALSIVISYWTSFLFLAAYIKFSPSRENTWTGFSMEAFHDVWEFLRLSIPATILSCLNTCGLIFMIPFGLSGEVSVKVANALGASRARKARRIAQISVAVVLSEGVLVSTALIIGRKSWASLYSSNQEVVKYVENMLFLLAASHILEGIQSTLSGIARGCGWQKIGAIINLGAYYLLGLPTGIVLAFILHLGWELWLPFSYKDYFLQL